MKTKINLLKWRKLNNFIEKLENISEVSLKMTNKVLKKIIKLNVNLKLCSKVLNVLNHF
jgi:hypothetical protein